MLRNLQDLVVCSDAVLDAKYGAMPFEAVKVFKLVLFLKNLAPVEAL